MKYIYKTLLLGFLAVAVTGCTSSASYHEEAPYTAPYVNTQQFAGAWYQIAAFPASSELCTKVNYNLSGDAYYITNQYKKGSPQSSWSYTYGKAWPQEDTNNTQLKVRYVWPATSDEWILHIDPNYHYAVIGSPDRSHLWILARKPQISNQEYARLVAVAHSQGYNVQQLVKTQQIGCSS